MNLFPQFGVTQDGKLVKVGYLVMEESPVSERTPLESFKQQLRDFAPVYAPRLCGELDALIDHEVKEALAKHALEAEEAAKHAAAQVKPAPAQAKPAQGPAHHEPARSHHKGKS